MTARPMQIHTLRRPTGEEIGSTYIAPGRWPDVRDWIDETVALDADLPRKSAITMGVEDEDGATPIYARGVVVATHHSRTVDTGALLSVAAAAYRALPV